MCTLSVCTCQHNALERQNYAKTHFRMTLICNKPGHSFWQKNVSHLQLSTWDMFSSGSFLVKTFPHNQFCTWILLCKTLEVPDFITQEFTNLSESSIGRNRRKHFHFYVQNQLLNMLFFFFFYCAENKVWRRCQLCRNSSQKTNTSSFNY